MQFTTNNLQIRPIQENEYLDILKIYSHENNMRYINDGKFNWTLEEVKQKWAKEHSKGNLLSAVYYLPDQKVIGEAILLKTKETADGEMEIGYILDEPYWGKGIGTELCKGLMNYCFEELKLKNLKGGLFKKNLRSANLLKKVGFKLYKEFTTLSRIGVEFYELSPTDKTVD